EQHRADVQNRSDRHRATAWERDRQRLRGEEQREPGGDTPRVPSRLLELRPPEDREQDRERRDEGRNDEPQRAANPGAAARICGCESSGTRIAHRECSLIQMTNREAGPIRKLRASLATAFDASTARTRASSTRAPLVGAPRGVSKRRQRRPLTAGYARCP